MNNLLTRFQRQELELEVEEELRLHVELLQREYIKQGLSLEEARVATHKRFGNLDSFKNECLTIRKRSRPLQRALKLSVILLVLIGLIVRFASADLYVARIGDTLIMVAVAGRLLLYVRSLSPSRFLPKNKTTSFSLFTGDPKTPVS